MVRMTHLIWRHGRAYFRYRLPPELRGIGKPEHWPQELDELVSEAKPLQLKHELSMALHTRDEKIAKKGAAAHVGWAVDMVERGLEFLKYGPKAAVSKADIKLLAGQYGAALIANDLDMRKAGFGLHLPRPAISLDPGASPRLNPPREPGLTDDDLGLLKHLVTAELPRIKDALARQRPPEDVRELVQSALTKHGIHLPRS